MPNTLLWTLGLLVLVVSMAGLGCTKKQGSDDRDEQGRRPREASIPTQVGTALDWTVILPEFQHTCGIRKDGSLWCWGANYAGQLGDGTLESRWVPTRVGDESDWFDVALGDHHSCARRADRSLWCWGAHTNGHPAPREDIRNKRPAPVSFLFETTPALDEKAIEAFEVGDGATCAWLTDGHIQCWGRQDRLGAGPNPSGEVASALTFPGGDGPRFRGLAVGSHHACGLAEDSAVWCWGDNQNGQLGNGSDEDISLVPVRVDLSVLPKGARFTTLYAGTYHTCGVLPDRSYWCWGKGSDGQLGYGGFEDQRRPVPIDLSVLPDDVHFVMLDGGFSHTCALDDAGKAWCWGLGPIGQERCEEKVPRPKQVDMRNVPTGRFRSVVTGVSHSCAIDTRGGLFCWGTASNGKLGLGAGALPAARR